MKEIKNIVRSRAQESSSAVEKLSDNGFDVFIAGWEPSKAVIF